jgi:hypothetical protein
MMRMCPYFVARHARKSAIFTGDFKKERTIERKKERERKFPFNERRRKIDVCGEARRKP